MNLTSILTTEAGITLLGAIMGAIWTLFKGGACYGRLRRRRHLRALQALEAAVEETYRTYVESLKASRPGGRLTPEERRRAREMARDRAIAIARKEGIDLLRELGEDMISVWIAKLVKRLKRR